MMSIVNQSQADDSILDESSINLTGNLTNLTYGIDVVVPNSTPGKHPLVTLTVPAIMFASGVIGNLLAIIVLLRSSKEHKQTVFYRLVGALAVTDLVGTCATSPITLLVYSNKLQWVGGPSLCNYESFMMIFAGNATLFIVGSMAIDRFIAIKHPFFYDQHISYSKAKFVIVGLWLVAAFIGCLPLMGLGKVVIQFPGTWCFFSFTSSQIKDQIFAYSYVIIGLFVISLTAISNIFVTLVLLQMRQKALKTMGHRGRKRHDSELQMMVLLLGIIVIFSTCWCPFMVRIIVNQSNFRQVDRSADLMALRLASLNQILDPWIYILFRKEMFNKLVRFFKETFLKKCPCKFTKPFKRVRSSRIENMTEKSVNDGEAVALETRNDECIATVHKTPLKEQVNLRNEPGRQTCSKPSSIISCNLYLKHSSCLFCFANHPKSLVISSVSEETSKSDETLSLVETKRGQCGCHHNRERCGHVTNGVRRESIHLSLTDLRREHQCSHGGV